MLKDAVLYRKAVFIVKIGEDEIYDLTVPVYHNYLAHGIWNHNSEVFDLLRRVEPQRYNDFEDFKLRYGLSTSATADALQQELGAHQYTERIPPKYLASRQTRSVPLTKAQQREYAQVTSAFRRLQNARAKGVTDIEAARTLAPKRFQGQPAGRHEEIARDVQKHAGLLRQRAYDHIVNDHPAETNAKIQALMGWVKERKSGDGKQLPGLIFATEYAPVDEIAKMLRQAGIRAETYTGRDGGRERTTKREKYQAGGDKAADVLVLTNAGSQGLNLQRASWIANFDTPHTAMVHEQRIGRIERLGQKNPDLEVLDLVTHTPYENRRRRNLKAKKLLRDVVTAPTEAIDDSGLAHEIFRARYGDMYREMLDIGHRGG